MDIFPSQVDEATLFHILLMCSTQLEVVVETVKVKVPWEVVRAPMLKAFKRKLDNHLSDLL